MRTKSKRAKRSPYAELLRHPMWLRKRAEILEKCDCRCANCGTHTVFLQVHHRYYVTGRMPWEYPDWALIPLCDESCHEAVQERHGKQWEAWEMHPALVLGVRVTWAQTLVLPAPTEQAVFPSEDNRAPADPEKAKKSFDEMLAQLGKL